MDSKRLIEKAEGNIVNSKINDTDQYIEDNNEDQNNSMFQDAKRFLML